MSWQPVTRHYNQSYFQQVLGRMLRDPGWYERRAEVVARTYFQDVPGSRGRVLEYGCGIGQNIARLERAVGYDISPAALEECRRRGIATIDRAADLPRAAFDCVLCRHVLEHVERPLDTVRELLGLLRPGGVLILVVPHETHRRASLEPDLHRHLFSWNFRCLNNLVHAAGGRVTVNRYEPSFGPRTDALLRPVRSCLGFPAYYRLGRLAGRLLRQYELVVHVERGAEPPPDGSLESRPGADA